MRRILLMLVLACGCDQVFGLRSPDEVPDAPEAPDDGPIDPDAPWSTAVVDLAMPIGVGDDPTFTEDLLEIHFNDSNNREILMRQRPTLDAEWSAIAPVVPLNSTFQESGPEMSADGLTVWFGSAREGTAGNYDIMISTRQSRVEGWTTPEFITELNTASGELLATASRDGTILVFVSGRDGGDDLWLGTRASTSEPWSALTKLDALSSPQRDAGAYLSADALSIYFSSNRTGDYDLYQSHRASIGDPFPPPTPIVELNSGLPDEDPWVSPDGRHMFFMRQSGTGSSALMHATR